MESPVAYKTRRPIRIAVVLVFAALTVSEPLPVAAAPAGGSLSVEAAPTKVASDGSVVTLRVANVGDSSIDAIEIAAQGPAGVTAVVEPAKLTALTAGASLLVQIAVSGLPERRPASIVVRATGRSGAADVAAVAVIEIASVEPAVSLVLTGNSRLTDASPADVVAVITNTADTPVDLSIRAMAGQHLVRLAAEQSDIVHAAPAKPMTMVVAARQSTVARVQVQAKRPLRRGTTSLVVTATVRPVRGMPTVDVTAERNLDVELSADVLPGMLGVGSVLAIPGLVAVWVMLTILRHDRRRIGLDGNCPSVGSQIWDNKLWLLVAVAISLVAAWLYSSLGFTDLLDTYTVSDIVTVSLALGVLVALVGTAALRVRRRITREITPTSTPIEVLLAAEREQHFVNRPVYYVSDNKKGIVVRHDWGAVILTPPIEFTEIDGISTKVANNTLVGVVDLIKNQTDFQRLLRFSSDSQYINGPQAIRPTGPPGGPRVPLLAYRDSF